MQKFLNIVYQIIFVSHELQYKIQKERLIKAEAVDSQIYKALTRALNKVQGSVTYCKL
jgi:hypothetical protein